LNTEEKLQHFYDLSIEGALEDAKQLIETRQNTLDHLFDEHVEATHRQAKAELKAESDKLKRNFNKEISAEQLQIRRQLSAVSDKLKDKLFLEVVDKLTVFKETPEYKEMLLRQVGAAVDFAGSDPMNIYIDATDEQFLELLKNKFTAEHIAFYLSKEPFGGGMRAVIRSKNILIDDSFLSLTSEAKEKFTFDGGPTI